MEAVEKPEYLLKISLGVSRSPAEWKWSKWLNKTRNCTAKIIEVSTDKITENTQFCCTKFLLLVLCCIIFKLKSLDFQLFYLKRNLILTIQHLSDIAQGHRYLCAILQKAIVIKRYQMLNGIGSLYYSYLKYLFNVYFRVSLVNVYNICGDLPQHQNQLK